MKKGIYCTLLSILLCVAVFALPILNPGTSSSENGTDNVGKSENKITDNNKPKPAPEINTPKSDETVTFIIEVNGDSLCDTVLASAGKYSSVSELIASDDIRQYNDAIKKSQAVVKASIRKIIPDISLDNCYNYNTVLNGFSVTAPYSSLDKLKKISGVRSVTLASSHMMSISENEPEDDDSNGEISQGISDMEDPDYTDDSEDKAVTDDVAVSDYTMPQDNITNIHSAYKRGFTGRGKTVAVIDDGFDCGHEVFSCAPGSCKFNQEYIDKLRTSVAFNVSDKAVLTKSEKIVYAYDYADRDDETYRNDSSHGTFTAALTAGNNGGEKESSFKSGAYDAQLILMKVCSDGSSSVGDDVFLAALDDAAKLSPDVINISLGVPRISTTSNIFEKVMTSLSDLGISVLSAAGNDSRNIAVNDDSGINSKYMDYGTISYPAALNSVTAVGSVDTETHISDCLLTDKDERIEYRDIYVSDNADSPDFSQFGENCEYVYTDSYGSEYEISHFNLTGKIAVVKRGQISVTEKISAAANMHAAGIIIISDEPLYVRFIADERNIPAAVVSSDTEKYFAGNPEGKIRASEYKGIFTSENAGKPSGFTSYGVTSALQLKPDFLAPGTDIYSALDDGYGALSGTSVSSAIAAGNVAVISEYVQKSASEISAKELRKACSALIMNTADRVKYSDKLYYTPRLQGAGCMNIERALDSSAYVISQNGCGGVSMGDSESGEFSFSLTLTSLSDRDTTYKLSSVIQTDKIIYKNREYYNTLTPENIDKYTDVSFFEGDKEISDITLPAHDSIDITVNVRLSPEAVLLYIGKAENGFYVDGFIEFSPTSDTSALSVPLTGYCGSWDLSGIFDASVYSKSEKPVINGDSLIGAAADGSLYPGVVLGKNMTTGKCDEENICIGRDSIKNAYDSATAGISFIVPNFYLLRDASDYTITITDKSGKTIFSQDIGTISSFAGGGYEAYAELLSSFNADGLKNLFSEISEGEYMYTVSACAVPSDGETTHVQSVSYPFTVDNTVPDKPETRTYCEDDKIFLEVQSGDLNGIQGFILYTAVKSGNKCTYADKLDELIDGNYMDGDSYSLVRMEDDGESTKFIYDITELYNQLVKVKSHTDFADNEKLDQTKLVVRAVDNAYNLSVPVTADSVVNATVTYKLTDQNGKPVRGVKLELAGMTAESGRDGIAVFDKVIPGNYDVSIVEVPEGYTTDFSSGTLLMTMDKIKYEENISFHFSGEYPPEEESENSQQEISAQDETSNQKEINNVIRFDNDNSSFALVFVGILLIISMATLTIRRRRTKRANRY